MIPKPLNEIEWSDIEALRDSGREEDDTIEFKSSFSGGSDFLAFNDKQRNDAVDGIVKEVIAFLNGRGGDVVIGAKEFKNEHPKIEVLTPLPNVVQTVDRLAQALAAVIEPMQSILSVRAITCPVEVGSGIIVVRAPSSLRAPHRSKRLKECYVRRGRESVPMPMDEVQDLTLMRTARRSELLARLDTALADIGHLKVRRVSLPNDRLRLKIAYQPHVAGEISISTEALSALRQAKPIMAMNGRVFDHLSILEYLDHQGMRMLRGRIYEGWKDRGARQVYCSASITSSLALEWDYADSGRHPNNNSDAEIGIYDSWAIGFFARALFSLRRLLELNNTFAHGVLRVGYFCNGTQKLVVGDSHWGDVFELPEGRIILPDFEIADVSNMADIFAQIQEDFYSIAGVEKFQKFEISNWQ
jgi:hypothetical protein